MFLTAHFNCFWLTTHCRHGTNKAVQYLSQYYDSETVQLLSKVQPAYWNDLKTEGIDFDEDFIWLEDAPLEADQSDWAVQGSLARETQQSQ